MVQMSDVGSGRCELILLGGEFLEQLARHTGTSLLLMNSDAFLGTTILDIMQGNSEGNSR
jgi:hypothetical protein